ncbi:MAG: hypothetical protein KKF16_03000 [Euryarchaeota archaeon]|nr:hypothetical protein [Euryarchaeota archaeon]MBU4547800.1 hypothetical protein [Euryarchaeota archaeon]MBV1755411.1 hypothetical protein [Methanobacterium sp.]MBV1767512.1 hypothetical protein [Methanobacterium sp.]
MTPIELLAILILAGAIVVLLYYYLQNNGYAGMGKMKSQVYELGDKVSGQETVSEASEKFSGVGEKMSGVGEKVSGVSDKIMGKVKDVPISTDILSNKIDAFLDEKSDELIEDWSLATKTDIQDLEKRMNVVTRDIDSLEKRFNEYRGFTNKKLDSIDERLKALEEPEE